MRFVVARLLVLLAALMVLPGSAWSHVHYLCHMSGRVQPSCCCEQRRISRESERAPSVRASDCCERLTPGDGVKATSTRATTDSVPPAALAALLPDPLYLGPSLQASHPVIRQSRGPPRSTRPLFIVNCAYLS
jgi:hypothetical protein